MRGARIGRDIGSGPAGHAPDRGRVGRPRLRYVTRGRLALLLVAAIGLPWIPIPDVPPRDLSMRRIPGRPGASILRSAIRPDGRVIATADGGGRVAQRSAVTGRGVERAVDLPGFGTALAYSPDGRRLAVGREEADVFLCALDGEHRPRPLGIPVRMAVDLRFSPDGRTLAVASYRSVEFLLWDLDAGRCRMTLRGHRGPATTLAFAPDGRSLASASHFDATILIWDIASGRPRHRLIAPTSPVLDVAYSPDGGLLATADVSRESVRIWEDRTGTLLRAIPEGPQPVRSVAFSPDGRRLATASHDGTASLWDPATGRRLHRVDARAASLSRVAFSPDGRTLIATGSDADLRLWDLGGPDAPE